MVRPWPLVLFSSLLAGCATPSLPDGTGRGLLAWDPEPPADSEAYSRPELEVGTHYALLEGGVVRHEFAVTGKEAGGYVITDDEGHRLLRDHDLGYLGQLDAEGEPIDLLSPVDVRFHWPLWVGKRWKCEYVDRQLGRPAFTVEAAYEVEELDRVKVPAGTFTALRIRRTATLRAEGGPYLERTSMVWYAPSIGFEVRQLLDDTAYDLVEWTRPKAR